MKIASTPRLVPAGRARRRRGGLLAAPARRRSSRSATLRLSVPVPKEHPQGNGVAKMSACTLEKSGGKLKIQPFYDGSLGNDIAATQSVRTGSLDMVITSTAPLVGILPSIGVFDLPFLFNNETRGRPGARRQGRRLLHDQADGRRASSTWPIGRTAFATRPTRSGRSPRSRTSTA